MKKYLIPVIIIAFAIAYMANLASIGNKTDASQRELLELGKINNTYHRANSCIITMDPSMRTTEFKRSCYDRAEEITGVKVERFHAE